MHGRIETVDDDGERARLRARAVRIRAATALIAAALTAAILALP